MWIEGVEREEVEEGMEGLGLGYIVLAIHDGDIPEYTALQPYRSAC